MTIRRVYRQADSGTGFASVGGLTLRERRTVPYLEFLDDAIHHAVGSRPDDELLWPANEGGYLRPGNAASGWFAGAVKRVQAEDSAAAVEVGTRAGRELSKMPRVAPHDLRHTAASLAISAGANVKAVQRMLGHASAAMTLDTYADLFEDDLDDVAIALNRHREANL